MIPWFLDSLIGHPHTNIYLLDSSFKHHFAHWDFPKTIRHSKSEFSVSKTERLKLTSRVLLIETSRCPVAIFLPFISGCFLGVHEIRWWQDQFAARESRLGLLELIQRSALIENLLTGKKIKGTCWKWWWISRSLSCDCLRYLTDVLRDCISCASTSTIDMFSLVLLLLVFFARSYLGQVMIQHVL